MPTTVDLEVAMTSLTVIRGVYSSGAERWQAGGGHPVGYRFRIRSGTHERRTEATPSSPAFRPFQSLNERVPSRRAEPGSPEAGNRQEGNGPQLSKAPQGTVRSRPTAAPWTPLPEVTRAAPGRTFNRDPDHDLRRPSG